MSDIRSRLADAIAADLEIRRGTVQTWGVHIAEVLLSLPGIAITFDPVSENLEEVRSPSCKGFQWIGQSLEHCDRCGQPYWEHTHNEEFNRDKGPFDEDCWIYVPISDESKARVKARFGAAAVQAQEEQ